MKGPIMVPCKAKLAILRTVGLLALTACVAGQASSAGDKTAHSDCHGDPLPPEALVRLGTIRLRCPTQYPCAFTRDGKLLLSAGTDGLCAWDRATGKEIRRMAGDQCRDPAGPISLSPDDKLVACGGYDQDGKGGAVYELATGRRVYHFGKPGHYTQGCFSPDGSTLAVSKYDDAVIDIHDAATGARLRSLVGHKANTELNTQQARGIFSPDGKILISAGADETIRFWNVATGAELHRLDIGPRYVTDFALSPDGSSLGAICVSIEKRPGENVGSLVSDDHLHLWNLGLGKQDSSMVNGARQLVVPTLKNEQGRSHGHRSLVFLPHGKALLVSSWDSKLRLVDSATGKELRQIPNYRGFQIALAPDGKTFAESDYQAIRVRDLATGRDLVLTAGHADAVSARFSPDQRTIITASSDGTIRLWDARAGQELRQLGSYQELRLKNLCYTSDGSALYAVGEHDGKPAIWDLMTGREIRRLTEDEDKSGWGLLALSPDGKTLASGGPGNTLRLSDGATGKELRILKGPKDVVAFAFFSGHGRTLLAWSFDNHLHSWDPATGQHQRRPCDQDGTGPHGFASSPDGRLLALAGADHITVFHTGTGRELCRFIHGDGSRDDCIYHLVFSPDGHTLAWAVARNAVIHLGEVLTGKERHRLAGHRGTINSLAFSADGKRLLSGGSDTTALVWDLFAHADSLPPKLAASDLPQLWADLAALDPSKAHRAIAKLIGALDQSVAFLEQHLRPVPAPDANRLAQLIADLDSDRFAIREKATAELAKLGELAEPALRKALEGKVPLEVRMRIEPLLDVLAGPVKDPDKLRQLRAIEVLEQIGTPEARRILTALAKGASGAGVTADSKLALQRLAKRP